MSEDKNPDQSSDSEIGKEFASQLSETEIVSVIKRGDSEMEIDYDRLSMDEAAGRLLHGAFVLFLNLYFAPNEQDDGEDDEDDDEEDDDEDPPSS